MTETFYADIGYGSLTKEGEMICGDHVEQVECEDGSTVVVLADGLGSGVKACILSTLINDALQDDSRRSSHCRLCQRCSGGIAHLFGEGAGIFYIYSIAYIDIRTSQYIPV